MATQETYELTDTGGRVLFEVGDKELTLSFQAGDRDAYNSIYARYSARVQLTCQRMLGDTQDAQDAAQETFLRVYQALPRFNGRYQLGAWITRIATNVCLDTLRSRARSRADAAPDEVLETAAGGAVDGDPEEFVLRQAEGAEIQRTMAALSPLQRRTLFLRDLEGRDYKEIAATLGVSEARARVILHRARKGFKRSWTSGWVVLGLPARLLQRVRRLKSPGSEQVAQAASSVTHAGHTVVTSPSVFSCSHVIQSCSEIVTERIAAVATVAIVGVSAAGGAAAPAAFERALPVVSSGATVLHPTVSGFFESSVAAGERLIAEDDAAQTPVGSSALEEQTPSVAIVPDVIAPAGEVPAEGEDTVVPSEEVPSDATAGEGGETAGEETSTPTEPTPTDAPPSEDVSVPAGDGAGDEPAEEPDGDVAEPAEDPAEEEPDPTPSPTESAPEEEAPVPAALDGAASALEVP